MEKLKRHLLYTYGTGDMFFSLMVNMETYLFPAFLTDYAGFSLILVGQILWITSLIDIVCAVAAGVVLQILTLKPGGKYRSWFVIGPPLVAPLFVLQFTKIGSDLTAAILIIFGFVTSHLLFNIVFSASASMVGRMSQLPDERTILSASRAQGMAAAGLIFSGTAIPLIAYFGTRTTRLGGFAITVGIYTCLMILGYLYLYKITAGRDPYDESPAASATGSGQSVGQMIRLVLKNPPLLFLIFTQMFSSTGFFVITAFAFYYFRYVLNKPVFLPVFILAISISRLLGTLISPWFGIKMGKRHCYAIFLFLAAVGFACARFLHETAWTFTLIFCAGSLCLSIAGALTTALYSDTVIYGEWKTGKNIRAFIMGLINLPIKAGVLLRSAVLSIGLVLIGFVANTAPTSRVIEGIGSFMTFTPGAAYALAAVIFYSGYRIRESDVTKMQQEIAARKTIRTTAGSPG